MKNFFRGLSSGSLARISLFQVICFQLDQQLVGQHVLSGRRTELVANVGKCTSCEYPVHQKLFAGESHKSVLLS